MFLSLCALTVQKADRQADQQGYIHAQYLERCYAKTLSNLYLLAAVVKKTNKKK